MIKVVTKIVTMNNKINKKKSSLGKIFFFGFNFFIIFTVNAQSLIHVRYNAYYEESKSNDFSKSIIRDYRLFLQIDSVDYEIKRISDTILIGPFLPDSIKNKIIGIPVVRVKFVNEKKCYLSNFENVFIEKEEVLRVSFYYARMGFKIWKGFVVSWPSQRLAISYSTKMNGRWKSEPMNVCK